MAFKGIPAGALEFYAALEADNSKTFWEANKHRYAEVVRGPVTELCQQLAQYGEFRLFRPHNDMRFAKNKPPYKTHQGAYTEGEGGAGFFVQLSAEGLMAGTGYYAMAKDQLDKFRAAIVDEATGSEIETITAQLAKKYSIGAISELKTAPRGYDKNHPRIELLRRKGLIVSHEFGCPKWLHTSQVTKRIDGLWQAAAEMNSWLDTNVGPSELEPDGFFG